MAQRPPNRRFFAESLAVSGFNLRHWTQDLIRGTTRLARARSVGLPQRAWTLDRGRGRGPRRGPKVKEAMDFRVRVGSHMSTNMTSF